MNACGQMSTSVKARDEVATTVGLGAGRTFERNEKMLDEALELGVVTQEQLAVEWRIKPDIAERARLNSMANLKHGTESPIGANAPIGKTRDEVATTVGLGADGPLGAFAAKGKTRDDVATLCQPSNLKQPHRVNTSDDHKAARAR